MQVNECESVFWGKGLDFQSYDMSRRLHFDVALNSNVEFNDKLLEGSLSEFEGDVFIECQFWSNDADEKVITITKIKRIADPKEK